MRAKNEVAQVAIIDVNGRTLLEQFVKNKDPISDCMTCISGVRASDLVDADSCEAAAEAVEETINGKILVGHSLKGDLKQLGLEETKKAILWDIAELPFLQRPDGTKTSLGHQFFALTGLNVQANAHNPLADAAATLTVLLAFIKEATRYFANPAKYKMSPRAWAFRHRLVETINEFG